LVRGADGEAIATGVEYRIKLTYASFKEWEFYDRGIYCRLAIREIGVPALFF
jgi:hypothetical protein